MTEVKKLELAGPIGVIAAIACAQAGAHALADWPTSSVLWYLNLEVFRSFDYSFESFAVVQAHMTGELAQALWVVVPLLGLICIGLTMKVRLAVALASNLSLLYSALLLYGAYAADNPVADFSFRLRGLWAPSCFLAIAIMLVCFASSAISHRSYWREIFS